MAEMKSKSFWRDGQMVDSIPDETVGTCSIDAVTLALYPLESFFKMLERGGCEIESEEMGDICQSLLRDATRKIEEYIETVEYHTGKRLFLVKYLYNNNVDQPGGKVVGATEVQYSGLRLREVV